MSGFNTIKKSRKRSHEIDEKLNVLNRELEKTKDIQEQPAMNTSGLFTPVQQSLPQDPVQVPNPDPDSSTGATTDNWTQPVGDGEDGGTAGSVPDSFPFIVPNPGYQDPTVGWYAANGEPLYSEDDLEYDIPDASETGGLKALGGVQREKLGTDPGVINGYLRRDIAKDNFVDVGNSGANIGGVTFKSHPHLFKPINYWITFSFRNPHIDAYWPNNSLGLTPQYGGVVAGAEDSNPRALMTAYKYVGGARTQTFDPEGDRGSTTAGDPKGTGDPDQYPPIPWFERLGREAFERLKEFAEAVGEIGSMEIQDIFNAAVSGAFPPNPENNYAPDIAGSIAENEPRVYPDEAIPEIQKEKLIKNINWNDIGGNIPITSDPTNYSDDNFYVNDDGKVTPHTSDSKTNFPPNTHSHQGDTPNYNDNPLGNAGEFHLELVVPENGDEPYFNYEDHAYFNPNSADKGEVPNWVSNALANVSQAAGSQLPGYPDGIKGDVVKKAKIPLSTAAAVNPDIKNSAAIRSNPNLSSFFKESYRYSKHLIKENAYMALLDRTYKPTERDYVKYAMDTPSGRKQFDKDVKMVHEFIKKNPDKYEYVMKRYPKDDPRLSMLNYRMDRMTEASDKYLETQFPTNQTLFTKVKERTKKNMNLTDPKNFKPVKDPIKYVDVKKTKKLKETVTRHFNKPVKSKSMFGLNMGKVRKTNQKMIEKREQEQRIKEEERAYIQEKMSRQKSNWKDDLTTL